MSPLVLAGIFVGTFVVGIIIRNTSLRGMFEVTSLGLHTTNVREMAKKRAEKEMNKGIE